MLTIAQFKNILANLTPGNTFDLSHQDFDYMFPPGDRDDKAMIALAKVAEEFHCDIDNRRAEEIVRLTKRQPKNSN